MQLKCDNCSREVNEKDGEYMNFTDKGRTLYLFYCDKCYVNYWDRVKEKVLLCYGRTRMSSSGKFNLWICGGAFLFGVLVYVTRRFVGTVGR